MPWLLHYIKEKELNMLWKKELNERVCKKMEGGAARCLQSNVDLA
jgi:hypothetical protein